MSNPKLKIQIESETGELEGVILHKPGSEVENMTPENAERALYSDILNLSVAQKEYSQLSGVLEKVTNVFQVKDLLSDIFENPNVKNILVNRITDNCKAGDIKNILLEQTPKKLAGILIEGVPMQKNSLTNYLDKNYFELDPLHNFFFARDASSAVNDSVLINRMANPVRKRESIIMEAIFDHHPNFIARAVNPEHSRIFNDKITTEGGDILVARNDVLLIGTGVRTTSQGIDYIARKVESREHPRHIIVQELPITPESFIHLDMVFTLLDIDKCMVYEPLILKTNRFLTLHLIVENGKITSINEVANIPAALNNLGMPVEPILCGGKNRHNQEREQWHSGANFFAFAPGKIIGYERNSHTIDALSEKGFSVLRAKDVISGKEKIDNHKKVVVTIHGSELARGGGGARCMTMPVRRKRL
ncbi:MAG: arginine deiminase family protein [Bacteroidales bacterium]|nr:arginine deiminase family protein [Bacteroidales bacterium]